jgi:hypothetical protein
MPCSLTLRNDETSAMVSVLRLRCSKLDYHLDGFAVIHRTIAIGDAVDIRGAVEHVARIAPLPSVGDGYTGKARK